MIVYLDDFLNLHTTTQWKIFSFSYMLKSSSLLWLQEIKLKFKKVYWLDGRESQRTPGVFISNMFPGHADATGPDLANNSVPTGEGNVNPL